MRSRTSREFSSSRPSSVWRVSVAEREESRKVVMWEAMVVRNVEMSAPAEVEVEEGEEEEEEDEGSEGDEGDSWDKSQETRSRSCGLYRWLKVSHAFCTECVLTILFVPRVRIRRPNL